MAVVDGGYKPVELPPGILTVLANAPAATYGLGFVSTHAIVAGAGGAPDDAAIIAAAPQKMKLAASTFACQAVIPAATVEVRVAAGGAALSAAHDGALAESHTLLGTINKVSAGAAVNLHRSDNGVGGQLVCYWLPVA